LGVIGIAESNAVRKVLLLIVAEVPPCRLPTWSRSLPFLVAISLAALTIPVFARAGEEAGFQAIHNPGGQVKRDLQQPGQALVGVNLSHREVSDAGLKELLHFPHLHTLDLSYTKVTDLGLKELRSLQQLQTLNLSDTAVTDAGLKDLRQLKQLQDLSVEQTNVTDTGVAEFRKAFPYCRIGYLQK
jgi:Leucine-rich repeat (LRR) protein